MAALNELFGDVVLDRNALNLIREVLTEFNNGFVAAGNSDEELSKVYNNFRILDTEGRFPLRFEPIPTSSPFKGQIVVTDSFNRDAALENGKLVNVTFTLDRADASQLVEVVRPQLEAMGLVIGRLTGTNDTTERHVSLALRIPYTEALGQEVDAINQEINHFTFTTAAQLKVVTPTDIRTSESAIELISEESCHVFKQFQARIHEAAGKGGNKLPPLHITHGNSPVAPASEAQLRKLRDFSPLLGQVLHQYGLDLNLVVPEGQSPLLSVGTFREGVATSQPQQAVSESKCGL